MRKNQKRRNREFRNSARTAELKEAVIKLSVLLDLSTDCIDALRQDNISLAVTNKGLSDIVADLQRQIKKQKKKLRRQDDIIQMLEKELSEKTEALKLFQTSENKKDNTADIDYNDFYGFDNISVDDRIE